LCPGLRHPDRPCRATLSSHARRFNQPPDSPGVRLRVAPARLQSLRGEGPRRARGGIRRRPRRLDREDRQDEGPIMTANGHPRKPVVVVGNGMVGHRFCERMVALDAERRFQLVTFCEEPRPAYDRVNLSKYFDKRDAGELKLACESWYAEHGITLHVGDRASAI